MRTTALATALLFLAAPAFAAPWKIDPASTLTFTGTQAKDPFTGEFKKFTPVVDFDPAKPETGTITVTVDMGSAHIDDKDKNDSLPTSDWFDIKKFPTATFTSSTISKVGNGYQAEGNLTLHGITKPVSLAFTFAENAGKATVDGTAALNRKDFGVGQGQWKDDQWIAYPVAVKFHLIASKE